MGWGDAERDEVNEAESDGALIIDGCKEGNKSKKVL
jgi:hypothetical protein